MRRLPVMVAALIVGVGMYALTADTPAAVAAPGDCGLVVAHRTASLIAPENTVAGILAVPATGATWVEMDVQWSSSDFPVLMHDTTVDRTTNGTGAPSSMSLGALKALRAQDYAPWKNDPDFDDVRVPYAWDFMNAAADSNLGVLLHVVGTPTDYGMDRLRHYINVHGWLQRTVVMADFAKVTAMRGWEPGLRYALIEYNPATTIRRGESIADLGVEAYVVPARDVSPEAVAYWTSYEVAVWAWSSDSNAVDGPVTWNYLRMSGVDMLITNRPAEAIAACPG